MMTVQASKSAAAINGIVLDAPIFDPTAFRLNGEQAENHRAGASTRPKRVRMPRGDLRSRCEISDRKLPGPAPRGAAAIAIPKKHGGLGADYQTYALAAAEIGRYCGATALTCNMHVCSTMWTGLLADDLDTRVRHPRQARAPARRALQAYRRRRRDLFAAVFRRRCGYGRWCHLRYRREAGQGGLDRQRQQDLRVALGGGRLLRRALHRERGRRKGSRRTRSTSQYRPRATA